MIENEKELQNRIYNFFLKYFFVYKEVYSQDNKDRIDLILVHYSDKERKYPIGIEIKVKQKKTGKTLAMWLKQAERYSKRDFKAFGKCLVATCPQISGYYLREGIEMHNHEDKDSSGQANNAGTFLAQFGVGEIQKYIWHGN